jgi:hypothetical protein
MAAKRRRDHAREEDMRSTFRVQLRLTPDEHLAFVLACDKLGLGYSKAVYELVDAFLEKRQPGR